MSGQTLEAPPDGLGTSSKAAQAVVEANSWRGQRKWLMTACIAAAFVTILALSMALQITVDVPDTNSPMNSNHRGIVNAENTVGQTFLARRDNLNRISLLLTVEEPNDYSTITIAIRDGGPDGPLLREVTHPISGLTTEAPFRRDVFNLFLVDPRWQPLTFDPIPESAGRKLYFSIEGKNVASPSKVGVAMMFRSGYPDGTAYVNGDIQNAHVVFRAESRDEVRDYLSVLARNATFGREGLAANPATYAALGTAYALLLAALLPVAWRTLRQ